MRNEEIRHIQHAPIDEVMRGGRLRWFEHVKRKIRTTDDIMRVGVTQDVALDRKEWRRRTRPT